MNRTATHILSSLLALIPVAAMAAPQEIQGEKSQKPKRLTIGTPAVLTELEMTGTDGKKHSIHSVRGEKGTLVIFSCNQCPWVVKWEDRIAEIGNAASEQGIGVIVINSNDADRHPAEDMKSMKERAKKRAFKFPYVADSSSDLARAFGASKTPEVFLFDAELKLAYHGAIDDNAQDAAKVEQPFLKRAIDALSAGKPIEKKETKAMGCGIKLRPKKVTQEI